MTDDRYASVLTLVRCLAGAAPLDTRDAVLHEAFAQLHQTASSIEAERLDRLIWQRWGDAGNRAARRSLIDASKALALGDAETALDLVNRAIADDAGFAEAWNRRATILFMTGRHDRSIADIERVLVLEPRHYGALAGLGQILMHAEETEGALIAFEAALAINPHLEGIRRMIGKLRPVARRTPHLDPPP
ncbi:MAG TPA: tetratricopeptide repeat protein [Aliidongia sp.]|uniref:tetratricopeptide repeat protein n=1 Tax=Aliidongia sp. TaxID=1914230 RepID=UPI002DDCE07B|nr:tetratricopeptide repeat protein [Aliidongia sp.]HEV2676237.1 tetratricopeptide repeat protein [Aliidongia sp.]